MTYLPGLDELPKDKLSIIIPCLNEEEKLPLIIADLMRADIQKKIIIVDSGSSDNTLLIARLTGADVLTSEEPNRGEQLGKGALHSNSEWLLFLHADSRLDKTWYKKISKVMTTRNTNNYAWFFDLKISNKNLIFRLVEVIVSIRSHIFKRPYGDQGLLINKELYLEIGGYKPLHLMEDLDLILRLSKENRIRGLHTKIYTDSRKWEKTNVLVQSLKNAILRQRWRKGESSKKLFHEYYRN